jgi:6-phospho-beta-glucosidase
MKLTVLGGGGTRMPAFVRAVLCQQPARFGEICLLEPDELRRNTIGRLASEVATALGTDGVVTVTADAEQALNGADFVFSAIRVGGDRGREIDEQVALRRGLVGQETTGPGGCAMALRTIPVVLGYCELISRVAPHATLINFTNPAGLVTQAISRHGAVRAVGVCDTPGGTAEHLAAFLGVGQDAARFSYAGLNHLGWITSVLTDGQERIGEIIGRFGELQASNYRFAAFDPALVRRVGAVPTEYVYFYYDPQRYVRGVAAAGASRGQDIARLNSELLAALAKAFADGGVQDAWATYARLLGVRRDTYMRTDMHGDSGQAAARAQHAAAQPPAIDAATALARAALCRPGDTQDPMAGGPAIGGYEELALRVIDGLTGDRPGHVIVNVRNDGALPVLAPDDVVEVPARVSAAGITPLPAPELPRSARALVEQVKEYERATVEAAMTGDGQLAAVALALHPLVPGSTVARELLAEYREQHGAALAYLH